MEVHLKSWKDLDLKVDDFPVFHPCHDQSLVITPKKTMVIFHLQQETQKDWTTYPVGWGCIWHWIYQTKLNPNIIGLSCTVLALNSYKWKYNGSITPITKVY